MEQPLITQPMSNPRNRPRADEEPLISFYPGSHWAWGSFLMVSLKISRMLVWYLFNGIKPNTASFTC